MSKIEVNQISSQCGSTLTIGQSGDTVTLACGATQTGFGRTGTVDWNTTAVTSSPLSAVSGTGYFINTTSGAITVNLPAGSAGSIVSLKDYANTWDTNNVTVTPNGSDKINGANASATLSTEDQSVTLVYVDSTKGWRVVQDSTSSVDGAQYIVATGGTITCCGDYKIHTFTGPGTFTVTNAGSPSGSDTVDYMVVAGGGGGGGKFTAPNFENGGGGGAGGYRESSGTASGCYTASPLGACVSALPVSATGYPITVGAGGAARCGNGVGNPGSNSIFSTITSAGGGGGGNSGNNGLNGGSGGGSGNSPGPSGGTGNTPPVSPPQGNNGQTSAITNEAGGGGGAGEVGGTDGGGFGGDGAQTSINGTATFYAGGAGGYSNVISDVRPGGDGGGGGGPGPSGGPWCGVANTGGGASYSNPAPNNHSGGSGIVIIRYKYR